MIRRVSAVFLFLLGIAAASNVVGIESSIIQLGMDAFGSLLIAGIVLFVILCAWLAMGGYGFENTLLALYCFLLFSTDANILPDWTFILMLIVPGIVTFFAAHKVMNRGG